MKISKSVLLSTALMTSSSSFAWYVDLSEKSQTIQDSYSPYKIVGGLSFSEFMKKTGNNYEPSSSVGYSTDSEVEKWDLLYLATIGRNHKGMQRLYIHTPEKCIQEEKIADKTIRVNYHNVKFSVFCDNDNKQYLSAKSQQGRRYVIDEFKEKNTVTFEMPRNNKNFPVTFSAIGFIRAWDSFGGNAL